MIKAIIAYFSAQFRRLDKSNHIESLRCLDRASLKDIGVDPDMQLEFAAKDIIKQKERILQMRI